MLKLKECYTDDINNKLKLCYIKTKPCEFSYIENEKALLSPYLNKLSEDDINNMLLKSIDNTKILECEKTLSLLKEKLINIENIEKELVIIKPPNANNPLINKDDLIKKILQVFINIENFKHHNYNIKAINDTNHNKTYETTDIKYSDYETLLVEKQSLETILNTDIENLKLLEIEFENS